MPHGFSYLVLPRIAWGLMFELIYLNQWLPSPSPIHKWMGLGLGLGRECRHPNEMGGISGMTADSQTGLGRHPFQPTEGNESNSPTPTTVSLARCLSIS